MADARRQHYVPVFYLREFSRDRSASGKLAVTDLKARKQWWASARRTGFGIDFYTVHGEAEVDPYVIERELARVENLVAPIYREILETKYIPSAVHLAALLRFAALLAVRSPGVRRTLEWASERWVRETFDRLFESREAYEEARRILESSEYAWERMPPYEEFQAHYPEATIEIRPDQTEVIKFTLPMQKFVDGLLRGRTWSLVVIEDPELFFITSDTPLHIPARYNPEPGKSLQFDLPYPEVYMPLSQDVALVSRDKPPAVIVADREGVAIINARAMLGARFLYSREMNFPVYRHDHSVGDAQEMLRHLRSMTSK